MSNVGISKSSIFAIREETTAGSLVAPSAAAQFVPLKDGYEMNFEVEQLDNEEIFSDIGKGKSFAGLESVAGTHEAYAKNSGIAGTAPQLGLLFESLLGSESIAGTEYDTVSSSTTTLIKVDTGEGANFEVGEALLIKDSAGYSIRNIASITGDDLTLGFALDSAPASGVNLGKAVLYKAGSNYPTFSAWLYNGNGFAVQAAAGCTVSELSAEFPANEFGNVSFSYEGTKYYFNPIEITATSKFLDFNDGSDKSVTLTEAWYRNPKELATHIETLLNDSASTITFTVTYSDSTGKFTIAGDSAFAIEFATGANTANTVAPKIGFAVSDSTSATSHVSANAQTLTAGYAPAYQNVDPIVFKDAELMIGTQLENWCQCATTASVSITKEVEKVLCGCEENGVKEIIAVGRDVSLTATIVLQKYEVATFNHLLNNNTISAMLNVGPKSSGNWVAGKCINFFLKNATVVSRGVPSGENFITMEIELKAFVSSTSSDVFVNFI